MEGKKNTWQFKTTLNLLCFYIRGKPILMRLLPSFGPQAKQYSSILESSLIQITNSLHMLGFVENTV